jgi:hypothetical protein
MSHKHMTKNHLTRRLSAYSFAAGTALAGSLAVELPARQVVFDNGGAGWFDARPHFGSTGYGTWDQILFTLDGTVLVDDTEIDPAMPIAGGSIEFMGEYYNHEYSWGDGKSRDSAFLRLRNAGVVGAYWNAASEASKLDAFTVVDATSTFVTGDAEGDVGLYGYGWYQTVGGFSGRGYLGFYIENDQGGRHYGWADVTIGNARNEVTLHSFAYETVPERGVLAGNIQFYTHGDFDGDLDVDAADADLVAANFGNPDYDLDWDGDADVDDYIFLINWLVDLQDGGVGTSVGDFNLDGLVNGTDLSILAGSFGQSVGYASGDANGDGIVNGTDLSLLSSYYGYARSAPIPEPLTLSLLAMGAVGLTAVRNRR